MDAAGDGSPDAELMNPNEEWLEKYGRFWGNVTDEPKKWYQMTTREMYRLHMDTYAADTAALSFTKYNHPSFVFIKDQLGMRAVPYLLEDIQEQHPDGYPGRGSFWAAISLVHQILADNNIAPPEIFENDRGRLGPIRKAYVGWGIREGFITYKVPTIPLKWEHPYRFVPDRFKDFKNWVWRTTR